jgi:hypothetical protein
MLRIELEQANDEVLLHLDAGSRRRLATVLADWLSTYAGVDATCLSRENFNLVIEARRVLLSPDEHTSESDRGLGSPAPR